MNGCMRPRVMIQPLSAPSVKPASGTIHITASSGMRCPPCSAIYAHADAATSNATPACMATDERSATRTVCVSRARMMPRTTPSAANTIANMAIASSTSDAYVARFQPSVVSSMAVSTLPRPMIAPTDRSMPAVMITSVMPMEITPTFAT